MTLCSPQSKRFKVINLVPLKKLKLPPKIIALTKTLKPYSFFKGGVAREALITHFSYYDRIYREPLDYDFIVFASDYEEELEWDHDIQEPYWEDSPIFTDEEEDEYYRLKDLGDTEKGVSKKSYFESRDNTLNEVLLGRKGLYFTSEAKKDSCGAMIGRTKDQRPRVALRNLLLSVRLGHKPPQYDYKSLLSGDTVIDELIPILKAYSLGLADRYYQRLSKYNREIKRDTDPDFYLLRLLAQFKLERGRPFNPKDSSSRETIQSVIDRSYGQ